MGPNTHSNDVTMYKPLALCLAIFVAPLTGGVLARSDVTQDRPTIVIATIERSTISDSGKMIADSTAGVKVGIDADKARQIAIDCGLRPIILLSPSWKRAYKLAETGKADALVPTTKSKARQAHLLFPHISYFSMPILLFTHKDNPATEYTGLSMMAGTRVGNLAGSIIAKELDKYLRSGAVTMFEVATFRNLFENLAGKRLEYVPASEAVSKDMIVHMNAGSNIKALHPPIAYSPRYFAISRKGKFAQSSASKEFKCIMGQQPL